MKSLNVGVGFRARSALKLLLYAVPHSGRWILLVGAVFFTLGLWTLSDPKEFPWPLQHL